MSARLQKSAFVCALAIALMTSGASDALAQRPPRRPARPKGPPKFELSGNFVYLQGSSMGSKDANLIANQTGSVPFTLFTTSTDLESSAGVEGRLGYYLTPRIEVEAGALFAKPRLSTSISGDTEGAASVTSVETLQQYIFDGAVVLHFPNAAFASGRAVPFVTAGVGYLRQLHDDSQLVETGHSFDAGGGIKLWLAGRRARLGIRADARIYFIDGGYHVDDNRRTAAAASAGVVVKF